MCLCFSDWPISIQNSDPYPDAFYSKECQTNKILVACCKMFSFFKAIFNVTKVIVPAVLTG